MKFSSDIDIDFGDRQQILNVIDHVQAMIDPVTPHNTGVYVTDIPTDPLTGRCTIPYKQAQARGYIKLDFLNVSIYKQVKDSAHLQELVLTQPDWSRLYDPAFCKSLTHVGNHHACLLNMPEPVDTIDRLAMFLAVIRPAKRHLIGKIWAEVAKTVWDPDLTGAYYFKRSHSYAYAHLVVVHMNLLSQI